MFKHVQGIVAIFCTLVSISDQHPFVVISGMHGMALQHITFDSAINEKNTNMLRLTVSQAFFYLKHSFSCWNGFPFCFIYPLYLSSQYFSHCTECCFKGGVFVCGGFCCACCVSKRIHGHCSKMKPDSCTLNLSCVCHSGTQYNEI